VNPQLGLVREAHAPSAVYAMAEADEKLACDLVRRAGERLDATHWMMVGGTKSVAGRLGRVLEHRIFDQETGPHSPESFVDDYRDYEARSVHVVIVDEEGIAGAARTIWSPTADEPTKAEVDLGFGNGELRARERLVERYGTPALFELATTVVEARARHSHVTGWVLGEMRYQQMCTQPEAPSCAIVVRPFYRMISVWGHELHPLGGLDPIEYYGQPNQPAFFEPGPQMQISKSQLYSKLSNGWLSRVDRPLGAGAVEFAQTSSVTIDISESEIPVS
jgi:hypothetical protein